MDFIFVLLITMSFDLEKVLLFPDDELNLKTVITWAEKIGDELWSIGKEVTKLDNINKRYSEMNVSVEATDGKEILKTIALRMDKLIKEKVDAVLRIKNAAMDAEKNHDVALKGDIKDEVTYYSSKFSNVTVPDEYNLTAEEATQKPQANLSYTEMVLIPDPHFNNVLVNTSYSSVHVPTNIFDRWDYVINPIHWSRFLDDTFKSNYETDRSLMWQYYASTSGFLRHYPAFRWTMDPDRYDCRTRIWYIQAATCSKEVVILIDNSGTMYGMRNTIAQLTVDSLLRTFSNNDYISIFRLIDNNVTGLVNCFADTLIQATPENIDLFRAALYRMCPEKKISYKVGFTRAFTILHDFIKNKTEHAERRNQAVFLLTDTVPSDNDFKEIRSEYETIYNDTNIEVELFIYFIGKDIPDVREIQWEKCLRNGSIVHVRTMDEVPEDALKYLSVIARTQNESTEYYPVSWTHTFFDIKKDRGKPIETNNKKDTMQENTDGDGDDNDDDDDDDEEHGKLKELRLMTSVTTPVFSSKIKKAPGSEQNYKKEEMIGVAAIDVPVYDFMKLTMAHKIGVNGYAFVVTNNGYLLFHPYLQPVVDNRIRENFNSVDLTEIEFYDDNEIKPRRPHENILKLREKMVNQEIGNMTDLPIKFHYDDYKRVGTEHRNYFFAPLKCSPFSLGLALPLGYGNYWVKTTEEINNAKMKDVDYKKYFQGKWIIHPKWTYCDFRNNEKYNYPDRKKKLMKFFDMIFNKSKEFPWPEEHPLDKNITADAYAEAHNDSFESCFANHTTEKPTENYFCDKELVELLFFDANLTYPEFTGHDNITFMNKNKIRLKFVATQGGLTRWQNFAPEVPEEEFGEKYGNALDEVWYKSAVLLHEPDGQNFVFSVPQYIGGNTSERYITASHAIFFREGGNEAPGVVVGYQIAYETLKNITEEVLKQVCDSSSNWDCYIIDANGYIIYSRYDQEIGKFYGIISGGGALMINMVDNELYRNISVFNYQAVKDDEQKDPFITGRSSSVLNPLAYIVWILNWALSNVMWLLIETNIWQYVNAASRPVGKPTMCSSVVALKNVTTCTTCRLEGKSAQECPSCCKSPKRYEDICQTREVPPHLEGKEYESKKIRKKAVDRMAYLYLYTNLSMAGYSSAEAKSKKKNDDECSRPYFLKRISYTNLNLLLVRKNHSACFVSINTDQIDIVYHNEEDGDVPACNKKMINAYPRKKLRGCSDKASQNRTRELCSASSQIDLHGWINFLACSILLQKLSSHFIT